MGTRNLTMMVKNGEFVVAQYGQWDGYPDGQGLTILQALKKYRVSWLEQQLQYIIPFTNEISKKYLIEAGAEESDVEAILNGSIYAPESVSKAYWQNHPELSRDTGGEIIHIIADFNGEHDEKLALKNDSEFAGSFSCEWAYIIDFDKNYLEIYTITKEKLEPKDRFYYLYDKYKEDGEEQYCRPVKLIKSYDLNNLPDNDKFVKELNSIAYGEEDDN